MSRVALKSIQAAAGAGGGAFYPYTIDNSARFNDNDSAYLYRTPSSAGSQDATTISVWVKRANQGTLQNIFWQGDSTTGNHDYSTYSYWQADNSLNFVTETGGGGAVGSIETTPLYRDSSGWYHLVFVYDSANATTNDRMRIYVNGERVTALDVNTMPGQNVDSQFNRTDRELRLGRGTSSYADCYFSEFVLVDGSALDPTSFAESKNGVWVPKNVSGLTFGTNGFYLKFANSGALGTDSSGNGNNFTVSGLTSSDQMLDTPTSNTATWNSISSANIPTLSNGNLDTPIENNKSANATIGVSSGLWTWEITVNNTGNPAPYIGVTSRQYEQDADTGTSPFSNANLWSVIRLNSLYKNYTATSSSALSSTQYGVVTFVLDKDNGTLKYYLNGSLIHTDSTIPTDDTVLFPLIGYTNSGGAGWQSTSANFGQSAFSYTPNASALALCTANLPEPAIGPNSTTTSIENFETIIYTGDSVSPRTFTTNFAPDLVWIKDRSGWSFHHRVYDRVRGFINRVWTSSTVEENYSPSYGSPTGTTSTSLTFADTDNPNGYYGNATGGTYVMWNWKADGTSGSSNTNGSITSTVSANTDAGISIITYTGNATSGATVGHGLGVAPKWIVIKNRTTAASWLGYHASIGAGSSIFLNLTNAPIAGATYFNNTAPTSSVFSLGDSTAGNGSGNSIVAYAFAEKEGFSKFGSYTGNGSSDGPFIFTGMRPAWIMIKLTSAADSWFIFDAVRNQYNVMNNRLWADSTTYESQTDQIDFLSNGFKLRANQTGVNASSYTYIYMAFAENPFKYSNAR